jgi:UDP-glucose 4-epimerase
MHVVVTGGAGFIGSTLVDALIARGDRVVVVDDLSTGHAKNVNPAARFVKGDVVDPKTVGAVMAEAELVFHLASVRAVLRSVQEPLVTDRVNTAGTLNVLESARQARVRRVVSTSSSSVYGGATTVPTPEASSVRPRSPYAVSKLAGELYARVYWELHGLETISLRLFNVFGPRQRPDSPYAAVIPLFLQALHSGKQPQIHGDGHQSRDFTYVDDAVAGYLAAASAPAGQCAGRTYNVAGGREVTILQLLDELQSILAVSAQPRHVEARPGDVRRSRADCSAAATDLRWTPKIGLHEGLARTVAWFGEQSARA